MDCNEQKAFLLKELPNILKKDNIVVIAGSDKMMEACVQIGSAGALIPMMQNALLIAIDSIPDAVMRLKLRQQVATTIMTKDMTDLVDVLQKAGLGEVYREEDGSAAK